MKNLKLFSLDIFRTSSVQPGQFLYVKNKDIRYLWNKIFSVKSKLKPIGLAARDTLRLEMGYCLYGNELSETISPIEANLSWIVSKNKKFIGSKEAFEKNKRILIGLELLERGIARSGYEVYDDKKDLIGVVTSGTMSPSLEKFREATIQLG